MAMTKTLMLAAASLVAVAIYSGPAAAEPGGEPNNTGCNGAGNPNSPCAGGRGGRGGENGGGGGGGGGQGGHGGAGGHGGQGGRGGDASASATNTNNIRQSVTVRSSAQASASSRSAASATGGNASSSATGGNSTSSAQGGNATGQGGNVTINGALGRAAAPMAPAVMAGTVWSNNNCAVGGSLGGSFGNFFQSFGIGGSLTLEGERCNIREVARVLAGLGYTNAAVLAMCQDRVAKAALVQDGFSCPDANSRAAAPVAAPAPATPQPVAAPSPVAAPRAAKPDWCYTTDRSVLRRAECQVGG